MNSRRPPATAAELLEKLPDVHPSMVAAYLAEGVLRVLLEIRDELRALRGAGALVPEQRPAAGDDGPSMAEQSAAGTMTRQQRAAWLRDDGHL